MAKNRQEFNDSDNNESYKEKALNQEDSQLKKEQFELDKEKLEKEKINQGLIEENSRGLEEVAKKVKDLTEAFQAVTPKASDVDKAVGKKKDKKQESSKEDKEEDKEDVIIDKDKLKKLIGDDVKPPTDMPEVSGKGLGAGQSSAGAEVGAAAELEELAPLALLSHGGGTKAKKFIVGDPQEDGEANPELVEIDGDNTHVTPLKNFGNNLDKFPGFAHGTDSNNIEELIKSLPKYASGTMEGTVGMVATSGGMGINGNTVVETVGAAISSLAEQIPLIGPAVAQVVDVFTRLGTITVDIVHGFNALADKVSPYSKEITLAQANVQVASMKQDIDTASEMGPELARLYESSNYIWLDIQKTLMSIAQPMLEILVPFVEYLQETFDDVLPNILAFMDYITGAAKVAVDWFQGDWDKMKNDWAEAIALAASRKREDHNGADFATHFLRSMNTAGGGVNLG